MLTMHDVHRSTGLRGPAPALRSRLSSILPATAAVMLLSMQAGPSDAQVQTLGTAPPPSGILSTPSGPRTVSSKPVNPPSVSSRPLGSSAALPTSTAAAPSVVAGSLGGSAAASVAATSGARLPTFGTPRPPAAPLPAGGIGTVALPFNEPVIDTQQRRFPIAPDRRRD
jgi:hypothetical protein